LALATPASVPIGITEKQDGTLWFTEASGNRIGQIADAGLSFHNGPLLSHVQVETVYYGQGWVGSTGPPSLQPGQAPAGGFQAQQQIQQLNTFFNDITNSAYMTMLNEYGVGRGTFTGSDVDPNGPATGTTVTEVQIQNMLVGEIQRGAVPAPNA